MSVTFQQLLDKAEEVATSVGTDSSVSVLVDSEVTAEVVYPHAVRAVIRDYARLGKRMEDLSREHLIELTGGEGVLPNTMIRECLNQASFPRETFGSMVPYEDYRRYRFDNALCYGAVRGKKIFYSCPIPAVVRTATDTGSGGTGSTIIGFTSGTFTSADVGRRIKVINASTSAVYVDAFITAVNPSLQCMVAAFCLASFAATSCTYTIYDATDYTTSRSLTSVSVTSGSATVNCAGGAFTSADVGRRLRVLAVDGVTVILDAIIATVASGTQITVYGFATATDAASTAAVQYAALLLQAPGIPDTPATGATDVDLSPALIDDVIMKIASVLRGTTALESLIDASYGKQRQ